MEIFIGLIIGTIASIAVGVWATKKQTPLQEETVLDAPSFSEKDDTIFLKKNYVMRFMIVNAMFLPVKIKSIPSAKIN